MNFNHPAKDININNMEFKFNIANQIVEVNLIVDKQGEWERTHPYDPPSRNDDKLQNFFKIA